LCEYSEKNSEIVTINGSGKLTVNLTGLHPSNGPHHAMRDMLLGFSIDKTVSDALNPYMEAQDTQCILNRTPADTNNSGIIRLEQFQRNYLSRCGIIF
jgi:hypothetical protein